VGVDPGESLPTEMFESLAHVQGPDGRRFICGETAIDDATVSFGVHPLSLRHEVRITEVTPIDAVG
jgi:hypothetical protein